MAEGRLRASMDGSDPKESESADEFIVKGRRCKQGCVDSKCDKNSITLCLINSASTWHESCTQCTYTTCPMHDVACFIAGSTTCKTGISASRAVYGMLLDKAQYIYILYILYYVYCIFLPKTDKSVASFDRGKSL